MAGTSNPPDVDLDPFGFSNDLVQQMLNSGQSAAMHADFELDAEGTTRPVSPKIRDPLSQQGKGGGRPPGYSPKAMKQMEEGDAGTGDDPNERTKLAWRKAEALTLKEEALARQAALKYEIEVGNYLPRDAYREASATLLAEVAQGIRSLPDLLERKANMSPEQVELCEKVIDETLATLSAGLSLFTEQVKQ